MTTVYVGGLFLDVEAGAYREGDLRVDDGVVTEAGPAWPCRRTRGGLSCAGPTCCLA